MSVNNTQHNAYINNVSNIETFKADSAILSRIKIRFDLVLANINRNILLADMPTFSSVMKSGGTLVLSGFYKEDCALLLAKAESLALKATDYKYQDQWACFVFKKEKN